MISSNGAYRYCKWCRGAGCVSCSIEADKAYKKQFPDGPKPIATFEKDQLHVLAGLLSQESIESAREEAVKIAEDKVNRQGHMLGFLGITSSEAVSALADQIVPEVLAKRIESAGLGKE